MAKVVGIDLGTTNSSVAILKRNIEIVRNKEEKELTRSCVAWYHDQIIVGNNAYDYSKNDPINVITSIKRLMGNSIDSENVKKMISNKGHYKYGIVPKTLGTNETLAVLLNGEEYLPEEISAKILSKLKSDAEEKLNDKITHAVITVPAYFTEKQKYATLVAAKLADLKVQKLLPEPTAAAIAYGVDASNLEEAKTILVYDFGGGTFDVSIISVADGQYLEIGKGGNMWLGGDDIDVELIKYIKKRIEKEYNIETLDELIGNMPEKRRLKAEYEFKKRAEEVKQKLSSSPYTNFELNDLITDENQDYIEIEYDISQNEFNEIITHIIDKTIELTKQLISDINYELDMIDDIILVGGSSKIPLARTKMVELFGDKVHYSAEPLLEIAKGAAIVAQRMGSEDVTSEISIDEIRDKYKFDEISHTISHDIYVITGEVGEEQSELVFQSTEPLPAKKNLLLKTMYSNQRIAKFIISTKIPDDRDDNDLCFLNLKKNYPEGTSIYCTLNMDENETLTASSQIESDGEKVICQLSRGNASTKATLTIDETIDQINTMNLSPEQINNVIETLQAEIVSINSLDPDGTANDKEFYKIIYNVGELPNKIQHEDAFKDTGEQGQSLLRYLGWVLDYYDMLLSPTVKDDLKLLRSRLRELLPGISQSELDSIENSIHETIQREPAVDYLTYIQYAIFITENTSIENELTNYHQKIMDSILERNFDLAKKYMDEAIPIANKVYENAGQMDKIRTAVKF